jgi:hypothetical protein
MPPGVPVQFSPEQRRMFMYGPDGTFAPDAVDRAEISAAACPIEELLEIVGEWPRTAAHLAAQVRVPVHYVLAEHEALWNAGQSRVDAFAGMFTSAPRVDAALARGVGHNIDHHHLGRALQLQQLAFALTCIPVPVPALHPVSAALTISPWRLLLPGTIAQWPLRPITRSTGPRLARRGHARRPRAASW